MTPEEKAAHEAQIKINRHLGGLKTAAKIKARKPDFYQHLGHKGGRKKVATKGFGSSPERARAAGIKTGQIMHQRYLARLREQLANG
jgi:hypothetical protein